MSLVYLGRGAGRQVLRLGKLLGEGASGKVHAVERQPGYAAKLYHTPEETRRYETKIEAMLASPPALPPAVREGVAYPQIAWPLAKLHDGGGAFIGFLMPEIDFARSTSLVNLLQKNSRKLEGISEYYGYRVLVARNLASVFAELHRAGHHMIDLKPANLRFYPATSWMAVVDADGFSVAGANRRLGAMQLSDEYIAPEAWGRKPAELGEAQDLFALAAVIFQLLNNGVHPFAGTAAGSTATDLQTRIREGLYPYAMVPRPELKPSTASVHRMFRRTTRTMFDAAFLSEDRPDAAAWRDHLDQLLKQLVPCAEHPGEHVHFGAGCGFCGHAARVEAVKVAPRRVVVPRPVSRSVPSRPVPGPRAMGKPVQYISLNVAPVRSQRKRQGSAGGLLVRSVILAGLVGGLAIGSDQIWQEFAAQSAFAETIANPAPRLAELPVDPAPVAAAPAELRPVADSGKAGDTVLTAPLPDCPDGKVCEDGVVAASDRWVTLRYHDLLGRSDAEQRAELEAGQAQWEAARLACNVLTAPVPCRVERSADRAAALDEIALRRPNG